MLKINNQRRHHVLSTLLVLGVPLTVAVTVAIWFHFSPLNASPTMDHRSSLSKRDYAKGHLREKDVLRRISPRLTQELLEKGLTLGSPVFIRIFKESLELEVWVLDSQTKKFKHFKTWPIVAMSGNLGPKTKEGDRQAPEGFYFVKPNQMNPQSRFHLSFNLGYPNAYDRTHHYTGSALMVHGNQVSIGCFAMTDPVIEDIYTLCAKALQNGQPYFRVHSFPFRLTDQRLAKETKNPNHPFWSNLKTGYDWFETHKTPPNVTVEKKQYKFSSSNDSPPIQISNTCYNCRPCLVLHPTSRYI